MELLFAILNRGRPWGALVKKAKVITRNNGLKNLLVNKNANRNSWQFLF